MFVVLFTNRHGRSIFGIHFISYLKPNITEAEERKLIRLLKISLLSCFSFRNCNSCIRVVFESKRGSRSWGQKFGKRKTLSLLSGVKFEAYLIETELRFKHLLEMVAAFLKVCMHMHILSLYVEVLLHNAKQKSEGCSWRQNINPIKQPWFNGRNACVCVCVTPRSSVWRSQVLEICQSYAIKSWQCLKLDEGICSRPF